MCMRMQFLLVFAVHVIVTFYHSPSDCITWSNMSVRMLDCTWLGGLVLKGPQFDSNWG